jgi:hypothetical protein
MKHILLTAAVFGLISCGNTHNHDVIIMGTQTTDANDLPFEIDSITTVNQLLDSLNEVPSNTTNLIMKTKKQYEDSWWIIDKAVLGCFWYFL